MGLQEILEKGNKGKSGGAGDADAELNEALTSQVRVISLHFKQLASMLDVVVHLCGYVSACFCLSDSAGHLVMFPQSGYFNAPASLSVVNSKLKMHHAFSTVSGLMLLSC